VLGNYIGTNASGTAGVGNVDGVDVLGSGNTIGGTTGAARNVISGNANDGVLLFASGVTVQGNQIGTGTGGTIALGNQIGTGTGLPRPTSSARRSG
jgi:hypothetical protein